LFFPLCPRPVDEYCSPLLFLREGSLPHPPARNLAPLLPSLLWTDHVAPPRPFCNAVLLFPHFTLCPSFTYSRFLPLPRLFPPFPTGALLWSSPPFRVAGVFPLVFLPGPLFEPCLLSPCFPRPGRRYSSEGVPNRTFPATGDERPSSFFFSWFLFQGSGGFFCLPSPVSRPGYRFLSVSDSTSHAFSLSFSA